MKAQKPVLYIFVSFIVAVGIGVSLSMNVVLSRQLGTVRQELARKAPKAELKSPEELMSDYYNTEVATLVSPHTLRLKMDKGEVDFALVDVRSNDAYRAGHIRGAVNIPPELPDTEKVAKFKEILEAGKQDRKSYLVLYCYSSACTLGRKTGKLLAANGIYAKELSVGYNDWEQLHTVWNSPGEVYDIQDYIQRGNKPGELKASQEFLNRPCSTNEEYSC